MFSDIDNDNLDERIHEEPSTSDVQMKDGQGMCSDFDDENDDFGDFGDFEVASARNAEIGNVPPFKNCTQNDGMWRDSQNSNKKLLATLPEIIEQLNFQSNQDSIDGCDNGRINGCVCDLFQEFHVCDSNSTSANQIVNSRSLGLWSRLCNVEETNALNFLWNNSLTYINFLNALRINNNKRLGTHIAQCDESSLFLQSASCSGEDAAAINGTDLIDSLFVPPASFDWQTSGLSNPLTGSSMPTVKAVQAVLSCEYFNGESSAGLHYNGKYILKRELEALSLGNENSQNFQELLPVDIEEVLEKNGHSSSSQTSPLPLGFQSTEKTDDVFNKSKQDIAIGDNKDDEIHTSNTSHSKAGLADRFNCVIGSRLASTATVAEK